jgi:membrane protein YqaA with SNARE-associated domain
MGQVTSKAVWQSKTMGVNALALVLLVLDSATAASLPGVSSEWFVFAVIVANALLRFVSATPVTMAGERE